MKYGNLVSSNIVCKFLKWELNNPLKEFTDKKPQDYKNMKEFLKKYSDNPNLVAYKSGITGTLDGRDDRDIKTILTEKQTNEELHLNLNIGYNSCDFSANDYLKELKKEHLVQFSTIKAMCEKHNAHAKATAEKCDKLIKKYANQYLTEGLPKDTKNASAIKKTAKYRFNLVYRHQINQNLSKLNDVNKSFKASIKHFLNTPFTKDEDSYIINWTSNSYDDVSIDGITNASLATVLPNIKQTEHGFKYLFHYAEYKNCKLDAYAKLFFYIYKKFRSHLINVDKFANEPCLSNDANLSHILDEYLNYNKHLTNPNVMLDYKNFVEKE